MIARESATASTGVRLLLVEDDEGDAFLVRELLVDSPTPVDVVWVRSLSDARAALPDGFDCVLIDLGLPDAHGLDALRGVLADADDTAVLVLTGLDDEHRGNEAVAAGAQDYLLKGKVDASALMRSIRYAVERKRAEEQLRQLYASELQAAENARLERGLLPHPRTRDTSLQVTTRYRSGRGGLLGGDFFDVVETSDNRLHVLIGDVSGHGPDEAALGVCLRVAWRTLVLAGVPDEHLLTVLEDVLIAERRSDEVFATLCMLTVAASRDEADLLLAGHPAPLLLGAQPRQLPDDVINPAVGMVPGGTWDVTKVALPPSWRLMLFTDGLIEGHTGQGGARLGVDGLLTLLDDTPSVAPAGALADWLLVQAQALHGDDLPDDVAIVVVEHESASS
jgi:serine phosphatase RsbU (regulator of sigma subunit)